MPHEEVYALPHIAEEHLLQSGIDIEHAKKLQLRWVTPEEAQKILGQPNLRVGGILFPYFDTNGKVLPRECRVRLLPDLREGWDDTTPALNFPKYLQPAGTAPRVYFPPLCDWAALVKDDAPLIITEGEKKAIAGCLAGFPTLGLGGVWSFAQGDTGQTLIPDLTQINWLRRPVYLGYDSDWRSNKHVRKAARVLAQRLSIRGSEVKAICFEDDVDGVKVGLDDYLVKYGAEAFGDFLEQAMYLTPERAALLEYLDRYVLVQTLSAAWDTKEAVLFTRNKLMDSEPHDWLDTLTPTGRTVRVTKAKLWWEDPTKRVARRLVLKPDQPEITAEGDLNTFRGWGLKPRKGELGPWFELLDLVFQGQQKDIAWFEKWLAYPLQHPGAKLHQAVFVYGGQGVGKTAIGLVMLDIYGKGMSGRLIQDREIFYGFNGWLATTLFALGDDLAFEERRKSRSVLKSLIDAEMVEINEKYVPTYSIPNLCNFYFTANSPAALPLDPHGSNRRFFVIEAPMSRTRDTEWYTKVFNNWRHRDNLAGSAAVYHRLKYEISLEDYEPNGDAPDSEAKELVVETSRSNVEAWVQRSHSYCHYELILPEELYTIYRESTGDRRTSQGTFASALRSVASPLGQHRDGESRVSLWAFRNVDKWKRARPASRIEHYRKERARETS